ncbi:MAG: hypothetical protein HYY40_07670 [Bacteroidetes bacterium]|nr:hypothetical protein [Bacteroidota bacterium]
MKHFLLPALFCFLVTGSCYGQDDLMDMLDTDGGDLSEKVAATFKTNRVINAHTCETTKKGTLDVRISHRFSDINSGSHGFWGFDNVSNMRFSFDYGLTGNIQLGAGRSKVNEQIDGLLKWRAVWQTGIVPVSIVLFESAAFTPVREAILYSGADSSWVIANKNWKHRLSYTHQLIIARKFNERFSLELLPSYIYRNYIRKEFNSIDSSGVKNGIAAIGIAGRIKITKRVSIIADYFYIFSPFYRKNPAYFFPLGIGIEIETGGHVFSINFTNSSGIIEQDYIAGTTDSWRDLSIKFGFNISRVFTVVSGRSY